MLPNLFRSSHHTLPVCPLSVVDLSPDVALLAGCTTFYDIPIETPLTPKLDISQFQRVLIAGFVSGGSEDIDANIETARLLRSQLRRSSELEVIDTDVLPLLEIASQQAGPVERDAAAQPAIPDGFAAAETDAQEDPARRCLRRVSERR